MRDTARLDKAHGNDRPGPAAQDADVTIGCLRPWRIALSIKHVPVRLVFDLEKTLVIGRFYPGSPVPDIDLAPFDADELGVSREHLLIRCEGESVVIVDNNSSNGTVLNGKRVLPHLPYSVYHGDQLVLGALEMQVEMLIDPLE
jgi:hypothetical protein